MAGVSEKKTSRRRKSNAPPAAKLTDPEDDILVRILARVPYRSLCRFKCVSKRWGAVISDPDHREELARHHAHALAGFFYSIDDYSRDLDHLVHDGVMDVSARDGDAVAPFWLDCLPTYTVLLDSCNGILLCRSWNKSDDYFDYVVCNPATEKSVVVEESGLSRRHRPIVSEDDDYSSLWSPPTARLGYDPADPAHFHIFEFLEGVNIYSSRTGRWTHRGNGWGAAIGVASGSKSVFVNGVLHLMDWSAAAVAAVDLEGTSWRIIPTPHGVGGHGHGFLDVLQGRLCLAKTTDGSRLSFWVLRDYSSEDWILEHTVSLVHLFGRNDVSIASIHRERNTVFLVSTWPRRELKSYEMDSDRVRSIHDLGCDSLRNHIFHMFPACTVSHSRGRSLCRAAILIWPFLM